MAKRLTDSRKWDDPWFSGLPMKMKLLWIYILDKCDHAGIYKVNLRLAAFQVEAEITEAEVDEHLGTRIQKLDRETWHIPKFISFQYGELREESRVHLSVISSLKKEGVSGFTDRVSIGYAKGFDTPKNKDKDKDKGGVGGNGHFKAPGTDEIRKAFVEGKGSVQQADRFFNHYSSNGWMVGKVRMKDWKAAVRNWISRDNEKGGGKPVNHGTAHEERQEKQRIADLKKLEQWKREAVPMPQECREVIKKVAP